MPVFSAVHDLGTVGSFKYTVRVVNISFSEKLVEDLPFGFKNQLMIEARMKTDARHTKTV